MRRWTGWLMVAAWAASGWTIDLSARQTPDFRGAWMLNRDLSTAPGSELGAPPEGRGGRGGRGPGGMGGPGGGMGGRGGGGRGGFGGGGRGGGGRSGDRDGGDARARRDDMDARRALMDEVLQFPPRFTIAQDGDKFVVIEPDGVVRTYLANGKAEKHQLTNGTVETTTSWDGAHLRMTVAAGERLRILRTFELKPDPRRLEVTTAFEGGPKDRHQLAVYDPADAAR